MPRIYLPKHPVSENSFKSSLITGTLLLTIAGVLTRIIGFFYRIFLSRVIGARGAWHLPVDCSRDGAWLCHYFHGHPDCYLPLCLKRDRKEKSGRRKKLSFLRTLALPAPICLIQRDPLEKYGFYRTRMARRRSLCTAFVYPLALLCPKLHPCLYQRLLLWLKKNRCTGAHAACRADRARCHCLCAFSNLHGAAAKCSALCHHVGRCHRRDSKYACFRKGNLCAFWHNGQRSIHGYLYQNLLAMAAPLTANRVILNLFSSYENIMIQNRFRRLAMSSPTR